MVFIPAVALSKVRRLGFALAEGDRAKHGIHSGR